MQVVVGQVGHRNGQQDLGGGAGGLLVQFGDDRGKDFFVALVEALFDFVAEAVDDGAVFDAHEVDVGVGWVAEDGDDVDVTDVGVDHGGAALVFFEQMDFVLEGFGFLEAQLFGGGVHLPFELVENFVEVAAEYAADVLDGGTVVLLGLLAGAGGGAETDLVFHAGALAHGVAGPVLEKLANDVLEFAEDAAVGVGTVVLPLDVAAAGVEQPRVMQR